MQGLSNNNPLILKVISLLSLIILSEEWCWKTHFGDTNKNITDIHYSHDGQYIVVGSESQRITIYDTKNYNVHWYYTLPGPVSSARFSRNSDKICVTLQNSNQVYLFTGSLPAAYSLAGNFDSAHGGIVF